MGVVILRYDLDLCFALGCIGSCIMVFLVEMDGHIF